MAVPTITPEQRAAALERAMEARRARAGYKARLKRGEVTLGNALGSTDPVVRRMRVRELLEVLPGIGPKRARGIMLVAGIDGTRRVAGLGPRQRERLLVAYIEAVA